MKFYPPIESRETEELIVIANFPEDWNHKAVEQAASELEKRNISLEEQKLFVKEFQATVKEINRRELEQRRHESFSILDQAIMAIYLPRTIFSDWFFKREGYHKLHKQRIGAILVGIVFYFFLALWLIYSSSKDEIKRINEINRTDIYEWEIEQYTDEELRSIRSNEIAEIFKYLSENNHPTFVIQDQDTLQIEEIENLQKIDALLVRNIFIERLDRPFKHNRIEIVMVGDR